ncbi:MAG: DUF3060 domain-containing protein [Candidatus Methanoperedens sp.]|nr:DUF3060 domain-containing protein [Candidatus Methanoperedens sp.]
MKKVLFIFIILGIISSGCLETSSSPVISSDQQTPKILSDNQPSTIRVVSGMNQVIEISGDTIIVSGNSNEIKIININISKIVVSGSDNLVYYPKEAKPEIINSGLRNEIKT